MDETLEQRKKRLALFARDAIDARSDYQVEADAVVARTARLREERLRRDAVIPLPEPPKKRRAPTPSRKPNQSASGRRKTG